MKSNIKFWEYVILNGKKVEPKSDEELSYFKLAEFNVSQKQEKIAA